LAIFGKNGFLIRAFWSVFLFIRTILGLSNLDSFRFGDQTGSSLSCSSTVNGKMYIFGGANDFSDQISVVEHCGLTRVGTLPMQNFRDGGCNSFQKSNGESHILLCFGVYGKSDCHRYFKFHKNNNFKN